jgi:hypothetical protein
MAFRMGKPERLVEPLFGIRRKQRKACVKIESIFRTIALRFIEQLNLDADTWNVVIVDNQIVSLAANQWVASAKPLIAVGFGEHDLELPCLGIGVVSPNIMDAAGQPFGCAPWTQCSGRIGGIQPPLDQPLVQLVLVITKDNDIDVIVCPNGRSEKLLDRIPARQSPIEGRIAKEVLDFRDGERRPVVIGKCHLRYPLSSECERAIQY